MFFQIKEERIKAANVTRYYPTRYSHIQDRWYITIYISGKKRDFSFDTEKESKSVLEYLDRVFKVEVV